MMVLFMPTTKRPPLPSTVESSSSYHGYFWLPTIFSSWSQVAHCPTFDSGYLDLLARLAEDNVSVPMSVGWTEDMMRFLFGIGMKSLEIPVGSGTGGLSQGRLSGSGAIAGIKIDLNGGSELFEMHRLVSNYNV